MCPPRLQGYEDPDSMKLRKWRERKQKQVLVWGDPKKQFNKSHDEGLMGHVFHQTRLKEYALATEIALTLIFNMLEGLFQLQYQLQGKQFESAQEKGIAYQQKPSGNWPKIYPMVNGKPDFSVPPNVDGTASRELVRANGYVPAPNWEESMQIQMAKYMAQMNGLSSVPDPLYEKLVKTYARDAQEEGKKRDLARDRAFMNRNNKPGTGK